MRPKKIGELLVELGAVTPADVAAALGHQPESSKRLGELLVDLQKATPAQLARALSAQSGVPFVELPPIPAAVSAMVPLEFQVQHRIVAFRVQLDGNVEHLHVAVTDP